MTNSKQCARKKDRVLKTYIIAGGKYFDFYTGKDERRCVSTTARRINDALK